MTSRHLVWSAPVFPNLWNLKLQSFVRVLVVPLLLLDNRVFPVLTVTSIADLVLGDRVLCLFCGWPPVCQVSPVSWPGSSHSPIWLRTSCIRCSQLFTPRYPPSNIPVFEMINKTAWHKGAMRHDLNMWFDTTALNYCMNIKKQWNVPNFLWSMIIRSQWACLPHKPWTFL